MERRLYQQKTKHMEFQTILLCSLLFLVFINLLRLHRRRKLPPGPFGLPIVGNLFAVGPKPHESFAKLAKTYGPLMTIQLGSITTIVASSSEMAREVLQKKDEAFSGRFVPDAVTGLQNNNVAVLWISAGDQWRLIRKALNICLMHPNKLDTMVNLRHKAVGEMVTYVKDVSERHGEIDIGTMAFTTALNQMANTLFSVNVANYESSEIQQFLNAVKTLMIVDGQFNIADVFPCLKPLDPQGLRRRAKVAYNWLEKFCEDFVSSRVKARECDSKRYGDVLDSLLDYTKEEPEFNYLHIKVLLMDLILAGTETSSNTTDWAMTELLVNPTIMSKLREEITKAVGSKGRIEESDIMGLPYLQAVVKETMRLHLSVPLLVPHKTERDVKVNTYLIPKNTQTLVNAWAIARDPTYWENPTKFIPERFLGSEEDYRGQHFSFLPFGSGRRMCPGIPLAERIVSLMVASLVYHFELKLPNGLTPENLDMSDTFGLTLQRSTPLLVVPYSMREQVFRNYL